MTQIEKRNTKANPITGLTPSMAVAIFRRQYPGVPEEEVLKAGLICANYGLFPYGNQVFILKFDTKAGPKYATVIGIKGLREIAKNTGNYFSYIDGPRVMTEEEEKSIYGEPDKNYIRSLIKIKNSKGDIFPGYGNWKRSETPYGSDKGNTGYNMSFIRAERNGIDRLAPGALPDVEIVDTAFVEAPVIEIVNKGNEQLEEKTVRDIDELWPDAPRSHSIPIDGEIGKVLVPKPKIDADRLKETLGIIHWTNLDTVKWINAKFKGGVNDGNKKSLSERIAELTPDQAEVFVKHIESLREAAGQ